MCRPSNCHLSNRTAPRPRAGFIDPERLADAAEVDLFLARNAGALLSECSEFLAPYLTAAKLAGEVQHRASRSRSGRVVRQNVVFAVHDSIGAT